ncbi:futalosine hydrolase [Desertibacillus haloalkaliphilus]|uniref:futalosine hydrolase n=1 Tax=Desertibacillus haloalkaliphilus TaxID=1328930 RepID=UPI001C25BBE6|nr:futalosine hydrolase [Desertibacillus haloalkaliphilus]MBU8907930.1 futalosine hydrolase [Desertibacillus haloalkaliphilus]
MDVDKTKAEQPSPMGRVLVVTSVPAEQEAVLRGLSNTNRVDVIVSGVGIASAAASTAAALVRGQYDLVINTGIGGGFKGQADLEDVVVATEIVAADLGAETTEGFTSIDQLGFGSNRLTVESELVKKVTTLLRSAGKQVKAGPILTLSTVTGTKQSALDLSGRIPGAMIEAMEGFGVATAASQQGVKFLEIRAVSNLVGPRDRESWKIKEALDQLTEVSSILEEGLR